MDIGWTYARRLRVRYMNKNDIDTFPKYCFTIIIIAMRSFFSFYCYADTVTDGNEPHVVSTTLSMLFVIVYFIIFCGIITFWQIAC